MEKGSAAQGLNPLLEELTQGRALARQLETYIEQYSSPPELCKSLVQRLLSTWDRAICMAKSTSEGSAGGDLPRSVVGAPSSKALPGRGPRDQERRQMFEKRKTLPRWTQQVRVCGAVGLEGRLDDGFSWRKYGQKDILGAKHPRGYYRCSHRHTRGCPATKQVQRSDEDPSVLDVAYRGDHTCVKEPRRWQQRERVPPQPPDKGDVGGGPLLLGFRTGLKVKTEDPGNVDRHPSSSSSSFPPTPVGGVVAGNNVSPPAEAGQFTVIYSPPFMSPVAYETNLHLPPASPRQTSGFGGGGPSRAGPESDLTGMFGTATSATDSPTVDLGFMLDSVGSDPNFPFDASFFS